MSGTKLQTYDGPIATPEDEFEILPAGQRLERFSKFMLASGKNIGNRLTLGALGSNIAQDVTNGLLRPITETSPEWHFRRADREEVESWFEGRSFTADELFRLYSDPQARIELNNRAACAPEKLFQDVLSNLMDYSSAEFMVETWKRFLGTTRTAREMWRNRLAKFAVKNVAGDSATELEALLLSVVQEDSCWRINYENRNVGEQEHELMGKFASVFGDSMGALSCPSISFIDQIRSLQRTRGGSYAGIAIQMGFDRLMFKACKNS